MKYDVFLSHAHEDFKEAKDIRRRMERAGLRCFLAGEDIPAGKLFQPVIQEALRASNYVLLLLTPRSKNRPWVIAEAGAAWGLKKPILPLLRNFRGSDLKNLLFVDQHAARIVNSSSDKDALVSELASRGSIVRQFGGSDFNTVARARCFQSIDGDSRLRNLATGHPLYDDLMAQLRKEGWVRFAAGFKAGLYAHPEQEWCLKIMGMGVGNNPSYFGPAQDEHQDKASMYVRHERGVLKAFWDDGFRFQPEVKSVEDSIKFLVDECGVEENQAIWQCKRNHILITKLIVGVPFATQTGHFLNYHPDISVFDSAVLLQAEGALGKLQQELHRAHTGNQKRTEWQPRQLLHNDPMPANILFTQDDDGGLSAHLVDFELAQVLPGSSPDYVSDHIPKLYVERQVPWDPRTGRYTKLLDEHLMDQAVHALREIGHAVEVMEASPTHSGNMSFTVPFATSTLNVGEAFDYWNEQRAAWSASAVLRQPASRGQGHGVRAVGSRRSRKPVKRRGRVARKSKLSR